MSGAYAGGIIIGVASTACSAVGLTLQKMSHKKIEKIPEDSRKAYWKYPLFLSGILLMVIGAIMSVAVFALIGQSESSALGALTMVWNAFLSWKFLGEQFTKIDALTTTLMVTGTVLAVVFRGADGSSEISYDVDAIVKVTDRKEVWVGSIIIGVILVGCILFIRAKSKVPTEDLTPAASWALCGAKAFTSGLFSGTTGFCTKSTVEIVTAAFGDGRWEEFGRYQFWLILISLPCSLLLQVGYLNSALRQFDAMMVVPIYQSMIVIAGVGFGWLYFNEAKGQSALSVTMFIVGCSITVFGVLLLALKVYMPDHKHEPVPMEEEPISPETDEKEHTVLAVDHKRPKLNAMETGSREDQDSRSVKAGNNSHHDADVVSFDASVHQPNAAVRSHDHTSVVSATVRREDSSQAIPRAQACSGDTEPYLTNEAWPSSDVQYPHTQLSRTSSGHSITRNQYDVRRSRRSSAGGLFLSTWNATNDTEHMSSRRDASYPTETTRLVSDPREHSIGSSTRPRCSTSGYASDLGSAHAVHARERRFSVDASSLQHMRTQSSLHTPTPESRTRRLREAAGRHVNRLLPISILPVAAPFVAAPEDVDHDTRLLNSDSEDHGS